MGDYYNYYYFTLLIDYLMLAFFRSLVLGEQGSNWKGELGRFLDILRYELGTMIGWTMRTRSL